ncbi:colicin V production protein [Arachidicoccus ginsenosidimutans]|uniref:CvpA family protein n=1 Tax=Arachidicoccus sp. BS20 TaxID=1850526 RepID=UPI0007F11A69|nr:CvpA family protein [Arachidicoccus sp. BS20]ANI90357.1 colicin V production protein [Arachidicoccus sp. BS20]
MIDIITIILLALAIFKGYRQGVILAVFSFLAIIVGLAAAMKLSVIVAGYLNANGIQGKWLSFISFLLVLVIAVLLVRLAARLIQRLLETVLMGWANRLAGIALYAFLYLTIFSVVLFYVEKIELIKPETLNKSLSYPFIKNLGPWLIDNFGKIIPWFKNMFTDLGNFFGNLATGISK